MMREVVEARRKRPRRRPAAPVEQGEDPVDRPVEAGVSEKVVRRIMAEEGLVAHVPKRRRYGSYEGETTPAPANLVDRDFTAERPNEKRPADITRDQGQGREGRASRR